MDDLIQQLKQMLYEIIQAMEDADVILAIKIAGDALDVIEQSQEDPLPF